MSVFQRTIRLITFDVTHTLLKFKMSPGEQYTIVTKQIGGISMQKEDVSKRFNTYYKEMCLKHPNFGRNSDIKDWDKWWRIIVRNTIGHRVEDNYLIEKIATELIESYKLKDFWDLNSGCMNVLEHLKETGVTLGVISNFDPRLRDILKNLDILKYFDFVLSSYEAGYAKPDPEIFLKALLIPRKKIMPMQALHIGDNLELDYLAAKKTGWQSALISNNNSSKYPQHDSVLREHIFNDLHDLKDCFIQHGDLFKD